MSGTEVTRRPKPKVGDTVLVTFHGKVVRVEDESVIVNHTRGYYSSLIPTSCITKVIRREPDWQPGDVIVVSLNAGKTMYEYQPDVDAAFPWRAFYNSSCGVSTLVVNRWWSEGIVTRFVEATD